MMILVLLSLLFVNMFVAVVIETYNSQKDFLSFNQLLNESERSWLKMQLMTYDMKPQPLIQAKDKYSIRNMCVKLTQNRTFDNFIMICIMLNTCVLAMRWFDEPTELADIVVVANYVFMTIFTLEALFKIFAMRGLYFRDSWNIFDFTVVTFTLLILGLQVTGWLEGAESSTTILRCLRIGRVLRLVRRVKGL